jgi:hypothetical protein
MRLRSLALVVALVAGAIVYTQVRNHHREQHRERHNRSAATATFGGCDVYNGNSSVDVDFRGFGADDYCRAWVRAEGRAGEFWHITDVQASAGTSVEQSCHLANAGLFATVFQAKSNFGTPGQDICASLVGQGWTEQ